MDTINRTVTTRELRGQMSDILGYAKYGGERIGVTRNGKLAGVIVSVEDLELLEALEDLADVRAYDKAKKEDDGKRITLDELKKQLNNE